MAAPHGRLWAAGGAGRAALAPAVGLGFLTAGLVIAQAVLLARIVTAVFLGRAGLDAVLGPLLALALVVALRAAAGWGAEVSGQRCSAHVKSELRQRLLAQVLELGPRYLAGERTGELAHSAGAGLDALDPYYARFLPQLALGALVPPLLIAWIARTDLVSGIIVLLTVPLVPLFAWLAGASANQAARRRGRVLSLLSAHFLDVVEGLPTLKLFGRSRAQLDVVRRVTDGYRRATMRTLRLAFLSALVLELAAAVDTALVAVGIGVRLVQGGLGLEAGLTVLLLVPEVYLPLRQVGAHFHASADGLAAAERAFQVLDTPREPAPPGRSARPAPDPRSAVIRFESVTLRHPDRPRPVLDRVDLEIRPGERLAVTGPSGGGKSTLLALLLCFLRPTAGRIVVAGTDLRDLDPDAWRRRVAWLPQRPHLFSGSIAENVGLDGAGVDEAGVRRALDLAGLNAGAESLPASLDTQVGERGGLLSGGQRQRVALARALARRSPLLLLDEPTVNLDTAGATAVRTALERLPAGQTCLVVTHDASVARLADRVLRLADGGLLVEARRPAAAGAGSAGGE